MKIEFPMRGETKQLTPGTRADLPGKFIQLRDGIVHYEFGGREDGPVVVLVHGFSVPYSIWDPTFEMLAAEGFRVLRYDLYGRGFSDRPHTRYDLELFDRQLFEILEKLEIKNLKVLIGLSLGGVIAANFTVQHAEKVDKLVLVDPAGFPIKIPGAFKLLLLPGLGELVFSLMPTKMLENALSDDVYDPDHVKSFVDFYRPPMKYKGFRRAMISTLRSGVAENGLEVYRKLGQMEAPPVLLMWGEEDVSVPFKYSKVFVSLVPRTRFHAIPDSGHIPHYEKSSQFNPILLDFLNG